MKTLLTIIQISMEDSLMKNIKVLGIDLAKNVFQLHGTGVSGCINPRKNGEELKRVFTACELIKIETQKSKFKNNNYC
jgi:hypothetical protein